ncbi:MAG: hypothetical protein DBX44_08310 [Oscillospiraceae bacterium]|nr:MAG: hypothetical protein DBX44_08310 [Oscillospiraceae bacterium]
MYFRRLIKTNALNALRQHWGRAVAVTMLLIILSQIFLSMEFLLSTAFEIPDFTDPLRTPQFYLDDLPNAAPAAVALIGGFLLLRLILLVPLRLGVQRWFYRVGDGKAEDTFSVFEYFSSLRLFSGALLLSIGVALRCIAWGILLLGPSVAMILFSKLFLQQTGSDFHQLLGTGLEVAGFLLLLTMAVFLVLRLMGYYLAPFAYLQNPDEGARAAIRRSVQATRGYCVSLLLFELSMIGWRLLDLLVVPRIFTYPYRTTARGLYAHYLFEKLRRTRASAEQPPAEPTDPQPE